MTSMRDVRAIASEYDVLRQRLKVARLSYRRVLRLARRGGDAELQASVMEQVREDVSDFLAAMKDEEMRAAERADEDERDEVDDAKAEQGA